MAQTTAADRETGMATLLFFDDNALGVRDNVIHGVGQPELIPESVWYDDDRLNTHWGYPGVFFDEADGLWRMVYQAKLVDSATSQRWGMKWVKLVAESDDGLHWRQRDTRKDIEITGRRFAHQATGGGAEWASIYIDKQAPPEERVKKLGGQEVWASPDGVRWKHLSNWRDDVSDAPMCAVWNEVYGRHFIYGRPAKGDRRWTVRQTDDWRTFTDPMLVMQSDGADEPLTDLYGLPVIPYEGMFIGLVWLYHGAAHLPNSTPYKFTGGKVDCQVAYSLNGISWQRTQRDTFIGQGAPGTATGACVYPTCVVQRPDTEDLWIYASASAVEHGLTPKGGGSIVAYRMRKDGFAYLESRSGAGKIATKALYWRGGELKLNVQGNGKYGWGGGASKLSPWERFTLFGGVRVQINDWRGNLIEGYSFDECKLFSGDNTAWRPTWSSKRKLNDLKGTTFQVAIELNNTRLYALRGNFQLLCPAELLAFEATGDAPAPRPGF
jgi:hypothetical protein